MDPDASALIRNRTRLAVVLVFFAAAVALIFSANNAFFRDYAVYFTPPPPPPAAPVTRLTIDFGNGTRRAFLGPVEAGMSVVTALAAAERAGDFSAIFDARGRVTAIAGVLALGPKHWNVYVNGTMLRTVPGDVDVRAGDQILLRYE